MPVYSTLMWCDETQHGRVEKSKKDQKIWFLRLSFAAYELSHLNVELPEHFRVGKISRNHVIYLPQLLNLY